MTYDVLYIDKRGDKQDFVITADSVKAALAETFTFCQDARRIIKCTPKPMSEE